MLRQVFLLVLWYEVFLYHSVFILLLHSSEPASAYVVYNKHFLTVFLRYLGCLVFHNTKVFKERFEECQTLLTSSSFLQLDSANIQPPG